MGVKKRIAIWIHGGIGTGHFSQGYPPLEKLLMGLSEFYELIVYSQSPICEDYFTEKFIIRSPPVTVNKSMFRWLYVVKNFISDHRRNKYDLIFSFWGYPAGFLGTCLSRIVGIPSVVYILGQDAAGIRSINFGVFHKTIPRFLTLWTYRNAALLLAISEYQKKQLQHYGVTNSINVIPWGVVPDLYPFNHRRTGSVLKCIHVGHLTPVKDQTTLLKALSIISKHVPVELKVFGVDCMNGAIQKLTKELGLEKSVYFLDMIPYHQMQEQYAWADLMLHTSLSEGQSMAVTEAAACGVLLAGTKVGLLYDLGNDCAVSVDVGDFENLAKGVIKVLNDPNAWRNKVQNAKVWSEGHDFSWTIREINSCLSRL
jgi:glycosyltransferase involved in cell wall biosynthesis